MIKACYRPDEVIAIMSIHKATFYRLSKRVNDPLPTYKIGGFIRVEVSQFEEWFERYKVNNLEN